ncbi:hypothetical protein H9Y04_33940 [Streptomyces sp. TRM66268-LWL]|uniref:DUF2442 domain-containing protein n=1 Tax=Streptomyces polyasparticus TaxID=2767826 RepID=A0ABR7SQA2_9ACTN|nr:hypothetical protein [Streptomyces polyasparticus]
MWAAPAGTGLPPWFNVRLTFGDGAYIEVLAVVGESGIAIEDMRAQPPLPLGGFAALTPWLEGPLSDACRAVAERHGAAASVPEAPARPETQVHRRARPSWPRGSHGRRIVAEAYRAAQESGLDPVLAVMQATGRSRRKSLRLIAGARDAGFLSPRHNRR